MPYLLWLIGNTIAYLTGDETAGIGAIALNTFSGALMLMGLIIAVILIGLIFWGLKNLYKWLWESQQ